MMNKYNIQPGADVNMTCLQGYVDVGYDRLVAVFGQPNLGEFDKVTCEWAVTINGVVATIYNWKTSLDPRLETDWHVGGHTDEALRLVKAALAAR